MVTFLKLQELMTTRPVIFAGYPILYGLGLLAAVASGVVLVLFPTMLVAAAAGSDRRRRSACCWCCRSAARTYRS